MSFERVNWSSFLHKHSTTLSFLAILLLSIFLRLYKLDYKSLWLDELYTIVPTNPDNTFDFVIQYSRSDQPPLFFLTLHYWFKLFSYSSFSGRLLSAIFGIFGVASMYFLGKEIRNERVGLFASLLTALNYFHIYYSQELRFYSLLFFMTVLSFLFYVRSLKHRNWISCALYFFTTAALLYTQYFGILIFLSQCFVFVCYVFLYREKSSFVLTGLGLAALVTSSFIPWLPTLLYDSQISSFWIARPELYFFPVYYYSYWGKDVIIATILIVASYIYFRNLSNSFKNDTLSKFEIFIAIALISWIFFSYAIPYFRSLISTPILIPRYTIVSLPAIFLIMALGLDSIKKKQVSQILVFVCLCSAGVNLFIIRKHYTRMDKAQWREAAQAVISHHEPNIKVYSNMEWWYNYYFYFTNPPIKVIGTFSSNEKEELQPFIDEIGSENKFWVLNGEGQNGLNGLQQQFVDNHFNVEKRYDFFETSAILYSAK